MKKKYQSELLGVLHQDALADYKLGIISEAEMREYDEGCLVHDPVPRDTKKAPVPPAYTRSQGA
jgi:hypothetical protein